MVQTNDGGLSILDEVEKLVIFEPWWVRMKARSVFTCRLQVTDGRGRYEPEASGFRRNFGFDWFIAGIGFDHGVMLHDQAPRVNTP